MINPGSLEFICGCMFSGKTEELIRRLRRLEIAGVPVQVFKSHRDTRFSIESIQSHTGLVARAIKVPPSSTEPHRSSSEILQSLVRPDARAIAIDEVQFFDDAIVGVCDRLASSGKRVILAGLTLDFRGEPFGDHVLALLAKADRVDLLAAVCTVCGETATRTQRLVAGRPAKWTDPIYMVGGADAYQAVCRAHHQIERPTGNELLRRYEVLPEPPT